MAAIRTRATSKRARERRRGETDEAHAKRIRALDLQAEYTRASRLRAKQPPPDPLSERQAEAERGEAEAAIRRAAEVALQREASERLATERALLEMKLKLDRERREKEELQLRVEAHAASLSSRNLALESRRRANREKPAQQVVILEDSGDCKVDPLADEIIQDFGPCKVELGSELTTTGKCLISKELSGDCKGPGRTTGQSPPLKGGDWPVATSDDNSPLPVTDEAKPEEKKSPPATLSMAEASELVLLVGWLDRARSSMPHGVLRVRFGPWERRIWRDVVAAFAQERGLDPDVEREDLPLAYELGWALRWALHALPPACGVPELAWRTLSTGGRIRQRVELGVLAGIESVAEVRKKYRRVERELVAGSLTIDRGTND